MKHVILFGGSFDPIHNGHLEIALRALKQAKAHEVWFVLAALSPFKEEATSFEDRAEMIRLMIAPYKKVRLCTIERDMPVPSYSIDTVRELQKMHPDTQFSWLIGSDQVDDLPKWKSFDTLNELVHFIIYPRPGYRHSHSYPEIQGTRYAVSSTDIRCGKSWDTSPKVLNYMMRHGLYLKTLTQHKMSEARYHHTLRVCELALEIAAYHRLDAHRVRLASMCHDWCKEWELTALISEVAKVNDKYLVLPEALYHGFAAASVLSKQYYVRDKQVLNAIRSHVTGASMSPLGMLLYIADKCERGRGYDSENLIELSKQDLRMGFKAVKISANKYKDQKHKGR